MAAGAPRRVFTLGPRSALSCLRKIALGEGSSTPLTGPTEGPPSSSLRGLPALTTGVAWKIDTVPLLGSLSALLGTGTCKSGVSQKARLADLRVQMDGGPPSPSTSE